VDLKVHNLAHHLLIEPDLVVKGCDHRQQYSTDHRRSPKIFSSYLSRSLLRAMAAWSPYRLLSGGAHVNCATKIGAANTRLYLAFPLPSGALV
jgi:hypothetical protein